MTVPGRPPAHPEPLAPMNLRELHARKMATDPAYAKAVERNASAQAIADQVVALRCERGMTQTKFAKLAGITQPHLARLESGEHNPTLETLLHIARAFGTPLVIGAPPNEVKP